MGPDQTQPGFVEQAHKLKGVGIVGLGLIGGSLALAIRRILPDLPLYGLDQHPGECDRALQRRAVTGIAASVEDLCARVDVLILAVPVRAMETVLRQIPEAHRERLIISDTGSVKQSIVEQVEACFGGVPSRFIPGHPIAGSERSGMDAASASLFRDHKVILTPLPASDTAALDLLKVLWTACGARVLEMEPAHHDAVFAATSHLPHLLAFTLVENLAVQDDSLEIFRYAAGGFRDFTRIAASDPIMWRDIFLSNRDAVLAALDSFSAATQRVRHAIEYQDEQQLINVFSRARTAREHFTKILEQSSYRPMSDSLPKTYIARSGEALSGRFRVPGDKSISHRSIMLGAIAEGVTEVDGFLEGEDALATVQAFRDMGVTIEGPDRGRVKIYGVGLNGLRAPAGPLYLGNSGTSMRLLAGLLSGQAFSTELRGDSSLSRRPMQRVIDPLSRMGASIDSEEKGRPPLRIHGGQALQGIDYPMPVASAQVKSALLLAGLYASGETRVSEPAPTRDHTERMLQGFGYEVRREGDTAILAGGGTLQGCRIDVPSDISSAAFFLVAASIMPGSDLTLQHVGINPTRTGVIDILKQMGANIDILAQREIGGEPVADLRVRSASLQGIEIPESLVPLAIDEFPVLFIAASCASGETVLSGAEELRVKESDRIQVMADGLQQTGVDCEVRPDGILIQGKGGEGPVFSGAEVDSHGDHRIAMAFSVAALRSAGEIRILDCANVATSFPGFVELACRAGMQLECREEDEQ